MNYLNALHKIIDFLSVNKIPYMIFGGIANSIYGNPRQTFDIDIKIKIDKDISDFIDSLAKKSTILVDNPISFVKETNVLPVEIDKIKVDIVFAELEFEINAIENAKTFDYLGVKMKVCSVEDFIIQKAISTRQKDWMDIETIISLKNDEINWDYLLKHIKELAVFLANDNILTNILKFKK
ncbi:MAG: nucleotidyltransferase [Bacteroidota bacterium]|nr:nucleotidyltransferase [Bacteroidota bacterium]